MAQELTQDSTGPDAEWDKTHVRTDAVVQDQVRSGICGFLPDLSTTAKQTKME